MSSHCVAWEYFFLLQSEHLEISNQYSVVITIRLKSYYYIFLVLSKKAEAV